MCCAVINPRKKIRNKCIEKRLDKEEREQEDFATQGQQEGGYPHRTGIALPLFWKKEERIERCKDPSGKAKEGKNDLHRTKEKGGGKKSNTTEEKGVHTSTMDSKKREPPGLRRIKIGHQ